MTPSPTSVPPPATETHTLTAAGTTFVVDLRGPAGAPAVVVIHGAGEDASMLAPFAELLAGRGRRVITYDRRGTGRSGHDDWPGDGADQHADDAAAILRALGIDRATVVGLSSGGVVALDLAVRHPDVVADAFLWEAPVVGAIPGGEAISREIFGPIEAHLGEHPGDFVGAQAILLAAILGTPVAVGDPRFGATRANAEPMVRDDPTITERVFTDAELAALPVTLAVGRAPNEIVAAATGELSRRTGIDLTVVPTDAHEVHLEDPGVLVDAVLRAGGEEDGRA